MSVAIQLEGLTKRFGERVALNAISATIPSGGITGLVGPDGAGKSTLLRLLAGLLVPEAGQSRVLGLDPVQEGDALRQRLGYMPQQFGLYEDLSVLENLSLYADLRGVVEPERSPTFARLLAFTDLARFTARPAGKLSGGMKQRMMIAMAISCDPSILIADEPTTALDVTLQLQILKLILRLRERFSMGVLFISHDLAVVHEIADKVSVIYTGKIVESADRSRLFNEPLHPYTQLLLLSIPDADKRGHRLKVIPGRVPDAEHIPEGCAFHPRCPLAEELCSREVPPTVEHAEGHGAACHMIGKKWLSS